MSTTVLKRLADLPTPETPQQEKDRRIREKWERRARAEQRDEALYVREREERRRGRARKKTLTPDEDERRKLRNKDRWHDERNGRATITYLDPPAMIAGIRVVGVSSDASPEVKREYGIAA
jgi:hypothetical protein